MAEILRDPCKIQLPIPLFRAFKILRGRYSYRGIILTSNVVQTVIICVLIDVSLPHMFYNGHVDFRNISSLGADDVGETAFQLPAPSGGGNI